MFRILVVDDDKAICRSLAIQLEQEGHDVRTVHTVGAGLKSLEEEDFDIAFIDLMLPDDRGLTILKTLHETGSDCKGIMITGAQDMQATIEAMQYGAFDYIRKPLDLDAVFVTLEKVRHLKQPSSAQPVRAAEDSGTSPYEMVGANRKIVEAIQQIGLLSQNRVPVLIQGESGTGKELVARALHQASCPENPFIALNCSAVVVSLLESELFGHEKGAFTGADARKTGRMELARDGILFFDEVGDLAAEVQAKLLRALQEKTFERVGGTTSIPLKARVVAATNRDLSKMVKDGKFREDLYFRLAVAGIQLPALRERADDIPLLVEHLLGSLGPELHRHIEAVEEGAMRMLTSYSWPGNVRELQNVLTRALLLTRGHTLTSAGIAQVLGDVEGLRHDSGEADEILTLREAEKNHIQKALRFHGWNITHTARALDISPTTLRKKIDDYDLRDSG